MPYKVKHENEHSFVVEQDGKHFTVAKKGLSASSLKRIQQMNKPSEESDNKGPISKDTADEFARGMRGYAHGGKVEKEAVVIDPDAPGFKLSGITEPEVMIDSAPTAPSAPVDTTSERLLSPLISKPLEVVGQGVKDAVGAFQLIGDKAMDFVAPKNPNFQAPSVEVAPAQEEVVVDASQPQQSSLPTMGNPMEKGFKQIAGGLEKEAQAQSELAQGQAKALEAYVSQAEAHQKKYEEKRAELMQARDKAFQEASEGKIDPNRYWGNRSTFGKVRTIVGLIMAGIGQGMMKSDKNMALEMLNKQIDMDLDAQRKNLDQKNNLYRYNLDRLKDEDEAYAVTRNQLAAVSAAQLQLAAARSQDPAAKARAQQALGQLQMQYDQYNHQIALQRAALAGSDPVTAKISLLLPKEQQNEAFAEKGIYDNLQKGKATISDAFKTINDANAMAANVPWSTTKAKVKAAKSAIMTNIQANWKGPMSDSDLERIDGLLGSEWDTSAQGKAREIQLLKVLDANAKATPILSGRGWLPQNKGPIKTGAPVLPKKK